MIFEPQAPGSSSSGGTSSSWTQYKQIISKPMPTCDGNALMFVFGTECTQITAERATTYIIASSDMCINRDGLYIAASYRAYPGKHQGDIYFSSTLTHIPIWSAPGTQCSNMGDASPFCF